MFKSLVPVAKLFASPFNKQICCLSKVPFSSKQAPQKAPVETEKFPTKFPLPPPREPMKEGEEQDFMEYPTESYLKLIGNWCFYNN